MENEIYDNWVEISNQLNLIKQRLDALENPVSE
jgi:hypothetical protein